MFKKTKELILNTWKNANQSATVHQVKNSEIDIKVILILIYTAVGLTVVKYFGSPACFLSAITQNSSDFQKGFYTYFFSSTMGNFHRLLWWISTIVIIYLVIPIGIIRLGFKKKVREYGFCFANVKKDYSLYIVMLLFMIPIVYFVSNDKGFQAIYPFFKPEKDHLFPLFFLWQIAYFFQFVAVEFFFRGFMIHGIKNRFGFYAIFVSTIPYCMVHFGKTFEETIAAIIAGVILGTLSLKSKSIFLGVCIHYTIAITMDLFVLWRNGYFC